MQNIHYPRGKRLLAMLVPMIAAGTLCTAIPAFALSPPNLDIPVYWGEEPDPQEPEKLYNSIGYNGVADIAAAFNYARRHEETRLGLSANTLGSLVLPNQAVWDGMSDDAKALYLINAERTARAGMQVGVSGLPLAGIESHVDTIAQNYAQLLHDTDTTGHFQPSGNSNIDSPFIRIANGVGEGCKEFLTRAENLAYKAAFSTSPLDATSIPLPVERAIYDWIYDDAGSSAWGHREAVLLQDTPLSNPTATSGFKNNHGSTTHEGFLGISRIDSADYTPFGSQPAPFLYHYGSVVVMNIFDPVSDANATGCNYNITLRTEDLPTAASGNHAPVANDDDIKVQQDWWSYIHVLNNDEDSDDDWPLTIMDYTTPTNGELIPVFNNTSFTYEPNNGFTGTDTFTYRVSDGKGGTDTATVNIEVGDYTPTANDDDETTPFRTPVSIRVLDNDVKVPSADNPLYVGSFTDPEHGTVARDPADDNILIYTPASNFSGIDTFEYRIPHPYYSYNYQVNSTATVTVTVGAAPITLDAVDDNTTTLFGKAVEFNILTNDFNPPNNGVISIKSNTLPAKTAGTLTLTKSGAKAGNAKFTPKKGFSGQASFTYTVTNTTKQTDVASVTITVEPNKPPIAWGASVALGYEVGINRPRVLDQGLGGSDAEDGRITKPHKINQPSNGKVTKKGSKYYYTPNKGFVGNDSFTYTVMDKDGAESAPGTVHLRVTATPSS